MKASLAAMVVAVQEFLACRCLKFTGSIGFLLTSDEEGPALDGTQQVVKVLQARGERIDYCIVGEPSSDLRVGDELRVGRRGSLHGELHIYGEQGHIAYPGNNPIHRALGALQALIALPAANLLTMSDPAIIGAPLSVQISNIAAGDGVLNGAEIIELGLRHATAHQINEHVAIDDLVSLRDIYKEILLAIL